MNHSKRRLSENKLLFRRTSIFGDIKRELVRRCDDHLRPLLESRPRPRQERNAAAGTSRTRAALPEDAVRARNRTERGIVPEIDWLVLAAAFMSPPPAKRRSLL